jgi:hypothetical protein
MGMSWMREANRTLAKILADTGFLVIRPVSALRSAGRASDGATPRTYLHVLTLNPIVREPPAA